MTIMSGRKLQGDGYHDYHDLKAGQREEKPPADNNNHAEPRRRVSGGSQKYQPRDEVKDVPRADMSPFDRLSHDLSQNSQIQKEITLGKRIGFYRIRGELGSGNFSSVKMGIHALTKEKVAIKILDKTKLDQKTQRLLSREISSMEKLHHPNIIRLYEVVETLAKLHIVMEYANGGELFTKISSEGKLQEEEAKSIFAQVVSAVDHMHRNSIIHRDLKAENVFYATPSMVKVGDFGFSTSARLDQPLNTFCGSPPYAAPELFRDESYLGVFVDIWALGIMAFFMVTGIMPFRAETVAKLKKVILEGAFTVPAYVSESCQLMLSGILQPSPQARMRLADVRGCDWLEGVPFPAEFPQFRLHPSEHGDGPEDETEARGALRELGIGGEQIRRTAGRDARSNVTGTYRIILHKIQKRNTHEEAAEPGGAATARGDKENRSPPTDKKQSRFCVVL